MRFWSLALLIGCGHRTQVVSTPLGPGEVHYVVVEQSPSGPQIYDCRSSPRDPARPPTCVRVAVVDAPPSMPPSTGAPPAGGSAPGISTPAGPPLGVSAPGGAPAPAARPPLISAEEAAMPDTELTARGVSELEDGPKLVLTSPENGSTYHGSLDFDIRVEPSIAGLPADMASLKVTYLKGWGIDITSRVRPYVSDGHVDMPDAPIPRGNHSLEIYIEDTEQNATLKVVRFKVE